MSFLRSFEKIVSSQIFTKPNNYLLQAHFRSQYLATASQPNIDYPHTVKSLIGTIKELENNRGNAKYAQYVEKQLYQLQNYEQVYSSRIVQYVYKGGKLTAEGIANIYYSAERLRFTNEWLEQNVYHNIPQKIDYMTRENLKDVLSGLQKYHKESPYLNQVKEILSTTPEVEYTYAKHQPHESNKFVQSQKESSNQLIQSMRQNKHPLLYLVGNSNVGKGYILHNDY